MKSHDEVPSSGGWMDDTNMVISIKPSQIHAAMGMGGDPDHPEDFGLMPMIFIIGGIALGNEKLDPNGKVAITVAPGQAFAMVQAALAGLLSKDGAKKVLKLIRYLSDQEDADNIAPFLYTEVHEDQNFEQIPKGVEFEALLSSILDKIKGGPEMGLEELLEQIRAMPEAPKPDAEKKDEEK